MARICLSLVFVALSAFAAVSAYHGGYHPDTDELVNLMMHERGDDPHESPADQEFDHRDAEIGIENKLDRGLMQCQELWDMFPQFQKCNPGRESLIHIAGTHCSRGKETQLRAEKAKCKSYNSPLIVYNA